MWSIVVLPLSELAMWCLEFQEPKNETERNGAQKMRDLFLWLCFIFSVELVLLDCSVAATRTVSFHSPHTRRISGTLSSDYEQGCSMYCLDRSAQPREGEGVTWKRGIPGAILTQNEGTAQGQYAKFQFLSLSQVDRTGYVLTYDLSAANFTVGDTAEYADSSQSTAFTTPLDNGGMVSRTLYFQFSHKSAGRGDALVLSVEQ